jgi:menaquinone-dependent protoporphyrinogen oxidase
MPILVAYATRYGATRQIAERIAEQLRVAGLEVDVQPVTAIGDLTAYDAVVLGSAVYFGSWMKGATNFARQNQAFLGTRAVWLFSSGPLGTVATDAQGHDVREAAVPKQIAELSSAIKPRDHRVFFGALNRSRLHLPDKRVASLPAFPGVEGDFRAWADVESWAQSIARALAPVPAGAR